MPLRDLFVLYVPFDVIEDTIDCKPPRFEIKMYFYFCEFSIVFIYLFILHARTV